MSPIDVLPLDPADDEQWTAYHRALTEGILHGRPYGDRFGSESARRAYITTSTVEDVRAWRGVVDGKTVGAVSAHWPLLDNTALGWFDVAVVPGARRQGVGSALLQAVEDEAAARGRTTLQCEVPRPLTDAGDAPGEQFASARGYTLALTDTHYVLRVPVPEVHLDALEAETAAHADGYRLESWVGHCPDRFVEAVCGLEEAFLAEAPKGDLDVEPERWDETRLREVEARRSALGRTTFSTVAVAPDGTLAGNSELMQPSDTVRGGCFQSGTLVLGAHRGHRLGLAMKVRNQRALQAHDNSARLLHTWNEQDNHYMIGVNQRLGFEPVESNSEWQRRLT